LSIRITLLYKENIDDTEDNSSNDTNSLVYLNYFITHGNSFVDDYKTFFNLSEIIENTVKPNRENENYSTIFYNNSIRSLILTDIKQVINYYYIIIFFYYSIIIL